MGKKETKIQNDIRVALSEIGIVRRNNVGMFFTPDGRPISIGIPGEADLTLFCDGGKTVLLKLKQNAGVKAKSKKNFKPPWSVADIHMSLCAVLKTRSSLSRK